MLEYIFGSKTRHKLLRLFFKHPDQDFFVRELARRIDGQINAIRREIDNLVKMQIILARENKNVPAEKGEKKNLAEAKRKYYRLNRQGQLFSELQALMTKDDLIDEGKFLGMLKNLGEVDYLILSGRFVGLADSQTDILIVGNFVRKELQKLIDYFERETGEDVRYTVMTKKEFSYRRDVADKFLTDIVENKHIVAIDNLE
jgi:hypothetical protein